MIIHLFYVLRARSASSSVVTRISVEHIDKGSFCHIVCRRNNPKVDATPRVCAQYIYLKVYALSPMEESSSLLSTSSPSAKRLLRCLLTAA